MTSLPATLSGTENQLPAHLEAGVQQARELIAARLSKATRKAYEADLKDFAAWAVQNQLTPMPATVESVVLYLTHCSASLKPSSISRKAAAIKYLEECADNDYFERGLELAIEKSGIEIEPVDISDLFAVEVDFQADLDRANLNFN